MDYFAKSQFSKRNATFFVSEEASRCTFFPNFILFIHMYFFYQFPVRFAALNGQRISLKFTWKTHTQLKKLRHATCARRSSSTRHFLGKNGLTHSPIKLKLVNLGCLKQLDFSYIILLDVSTTWAFNKIWFLYEKN